MPYRYTHLPISGGGYVTGLEFSETTPGRLLARTDIGGLYIHEDTWRSLEEGVGVDRLPLTYTLAAALDESDGSAIFAAGEYRKNGYFGRIHADGHIETHELPAGAHGNYPGRGSGRRMVINGDEILFASYDGGLLRSVDRGVTWENLHAPEINATFIAAAGDLYVLGCSGKINEEKDSHRRGWPLYVSYDRGEHFEKMPAPKYPDGQSGIQGYVAYRYAWDGEKLYVTFFGTAEEPGRYGMDAYGTDSVGILVCGKVVRYDFVGGALKSWTDVTPDAAVFKAYGEYKKEAYPFAFGGVDCRGGLLALSVNKADFGSAVLRSFDGGNSWEVVLQGLSVGEFKPKTPYLTPKNNDGVNTIHWINDIKIDPFNHDSVWFVTGSGTYHCCNFTAPITAWTDDCDGLEETVHMNVYSLPFKSGSYGLTDINVLDCVGDLGAFVFRKSDIHPEAQVKNATGSGYVTVLNADYCDADPDIIAITPRGNWRCTSKGGVAVSADGGKHFENVNYPEGFGEYTDRLVARMQQANVNSGHVALGAKPVDGNPTLVWTLCDGHDLPADNVFVSRDMGKSWVKSSVESLKNSPRDSKERPKSLPAWVNWPLKVGMLKVFSDRLNPKVFYGFGENFKIYVSTDCGKSFQEAEVPEELPMYPVYLAEIPICEIRPEAGKSGVFWCALHGEGLWRVEIEPYSKKVTVRKLAEAAYGVGLGVGRSATDYLNSPKTIYMAGKVKGIYGFYRSEDEGSAWIRINDDSHQFGQIRSIDGDCRVFGRFFIGTGTMGIIMGEENEEDR